jgi:plastocyanin
VKHLSIQTALALSLTLLTQTSTAGTVNVTVLDAQGAPAANVVVLIRPSAPAAMPLPTKAAKQQVVIEQRDLKFVPFLSVVPVDSKVRFTNRDSYDHHVRSMPSGPLGGTAPAQEFELRLDGVAAATATATTDEYSSSTAPPAQKRKASGANTGEIILTKTGAITLGCHLHSSMLGHVYVADTPWFAKTDASGKASIQDVPDTATDISLWHPDQLQAQSQLKLQVAAGANSSEIKLNFVPRKRRGV